MSSVERVFAHMAAYYGDRFAAMWREVDQPTMKRVWADELAGYAPDEIVRGLSACRTRDWPPTLPEFLKLCRPPLDYEAAFCEAAEQMYRRQSGLDRWSHPAIYWAAARMGRDVMALAYDVARARWKALLDEAIERVRTGELSAEVPMRADALPAPGGTVASAEDVRAILRGQA